MIPIQLSLFPTRGFALLTFDGLLEDWRVTYLEWAGETFSDGTFRNRNGSYRCFLTAPGGSTTIHVGAPASLSHAVDSPEAFDAAAHAAIREADNEGGENDTRWGEIAAYDLEGSGWHIGRSPAKAWPKESAKAV